MLWFWFDLLSLVDPMCPVSLDCDYFIASSLFSNVYFLENVNEIKASFLLLEEICVNRENTVRPSVHNMTYLITSCYIEFSSYSIVFTAFLKSINYIHFCFC